MFQEAGDRAPPPVLSAAPAVSYIGATLLWEAPPVKVVLNGSPARQPPWRGDEPVSEWEVLSTPRRTAPSGVPPNEVEELSTLPRAAPPTKKWSSR